MLMVVNAHDTHICSALLASPGETIDAMNCKVVNTTQESPLRIISPEDLPEQQGNAESHAAGEFVKAGIFVLSQSRLA